MKSKYEISIIGGGIFGLSCAYHLAKSGISDIAIFDKNYIGSGASGRNASVIGLPWKTKEVIELSNIESIKFWKNISSDTNMNVLFENRGYIHLIYDDFDLEHQIDVIKNQTAYGIKIKLIYPKEVKKLIPDINTKKLFAATYLPLGGTARHDALVWGLANACKNMGVDIFSFTEVKNILVENKTVKSVVTDKQTFSTDTIVNAAHTSSDSISKMVGINLPVTTLMQEVLVTEPLKPFLDQMILSSAPELWCHQTSRGEFLAGSAINKQQSYSVNSTLTFLEHIGKASINLFPKLKKIKVMRQWAGLYHVSPDYSPIIGPVPEIKNFILCVPGNDNGFMNGGILGKLTAEYIISKKESSLMKFFNYSRFKENRLVKEGYVEHSERLPTT